MIVEPKVEDDGRRGAVVLRAGAILFDMDGTLVDSTPIIHRAWKWWTEKHGIPLAPVLAVEKGRPNREVIAEFAPQLDSVEESRQFIAFEENDTDGLTLVAGADAAVRAAQQGLWAVVTSAKRSLAEVRLSAAGLPVPEVLVAADMISRGKPDPEGFLVAAERLGVEPADCLVFEDSPAGVMGARRAGMAVICISSASPALAEVQVQDFRNVSMSRNGEGTFLVTVGRVEGI